MQPLQRDYNSLPECDLLDNYILLRLKKGLYSHILVTGLPGTGKSSFGVRMGERLSAKIGNQIQFKASDIVDSLLKLLERIKAVKVPGEIIMIEEVSVLFPSRRSMAGDNVAIGRILDTCRKKQVILISNAPLFPSIDSHIRAMSHVLVETVKVNKTQKVVISKSWRLQVNPHTAKCYRHRFRRNGRDVSFIVSKKPSSGVWEQYEQGKDEFLDILYKKLHAQAQKKQDKEYKDAGIVSKRREVSRGLTAKELKVYELVNNKGLMQKEVAKIMGVHPSRITRIMSSVQKKTNIFPAKSTKMTSSTVIEPVTT